MWPPPAAPGVLVVDDEPFLRALLGAALRREGFPAWMAANGGEALDVFRRHRKAVRVVLLDVVLRGGPDGPAVLRALRKAAPEARFAAYFMSGGFGPYTPGGLLRQGAAGVLVKPFELDRLAHFLRRHLARTTAILSPSP